MASGARLRQIHPPRAAQRVFASAGVFHLPLMISGFGQYRRNAIVNGPLNAGSQLDSLSLGTLSELRKDKQSP
jgi:hypothetical protein